MTARCSDPACPCRDGLVCHYIDRGDTKAMKRSAFFSNDPASRRLGRPLGCALGGERFDQVELEVTLGELEDPILREWLRRLLVTKMPPGSRIVMELRP